MMASSPTPSNPLSRNKREAVSTIRARFSAAFSRVTRIVVRSLQQAWRRARLDRRNRRRASSIAPARYKGRTHCRFSRVTAEAANEGVEGRCEKQAEAGNAQHPKQHRRAERLAHFGTGTGGNGEGCHAQYERERRHQNRSQPRACGVHRGFAGGDAVFLLLTCELYNQDRVFSGQTDKNDKANLGQDVDGHAPREQACDRREKAHRHDQNDGQRELPALVLCDQNQKHEESRGPEDEYSRGATLLLLKSKVGPFEGNTPGKNLISKLLHALQCRAGGDTRRRDPLHLGSGKKIVARHAIGNRSVSRLCHRPNWHHCASRVAYLQAGHVLGCTPELPVSLDEDLVSSAEIVEVVHVL